MGTPRMKAAKFRWSCATAQTASREPISGKARYAGSVAASCASAGSAASSPRSVSVQRTVQAQSRPPRGPWDDALVLGFTGAISANF
ncbi:MAG: hypothetical protein A3G44_03575 [Candidatus Rokubacteria bacterium RIFCSPLOWO2_12_FULL_73_47]|nr:MAG: hypothetical protein A3G44_03575 [Candidatus Rokubacteria bacterium RIFCSPLOWO2_12_FULL_73_47]